MAADSAAMWTVDSIHRAESNLDQKVVALFIGPAVEVGSFGYCNTQRHAQMWRAVITIEASPDV